jgi:hypothetical protein
MTIEILMVIGFCLAAYSIVGNDVPQTLGTFISSNAHRPWWVLWLFISTILVVVLIYGWYASGVGDASYGRLETIPFPEGGVTWLYIVPPILLLFLTKYGIPVSTTFLVLTIFSPASLGSMMVKSMIMMVSMSIGVALAGTLVNVFTAYLGTDHIVMAFHNTLIVLGCINLITAAIFWHIPKDTVDE